MQKIVVAVVAFALLAGAPALSGSAHAQTCCVCTDCAENPDQARCFADIGDSQCADFCQAQECGVRELLDQACQSPLCEGFPPETKPAPALGSAGIALAAFFLGLAGMGLLRRRAPRLAGR